MLLTMLLILTLSLLWYGYHNCVKEGNGDRVYEIASSCCLYSGNKATTTILTICLIRSTSLGNIYNVANSVCHVIPSLDVFVFVCRGWHTNNRQA